MFAFLLSFGIGWRLHRIHTPLKMDDGARLKVPWWSSNWNPAYSTI
jgi:hypothetical protein